MPLEPALEVRPAREIIKRLVFSALVIAVGVIGFNVGSTMGAAKQLQIDTAEIRAWRNANACVEVPGFLREGKPNAKTNAKMHRVE